MHRRWRRASVRSAPFIYIFNGATCRRDPSHSMLKDWLPAALYARFEALKARFDPGDSQIEQLRPTFAALRLYQHAITMAGLTQGDEMQRGARESSRTPTHPHSTRGGARG